MPKAKPTQVIVHRIEAGTWERENLLKPVAEVGKTARMINSVALVGVAGAAIGAPLVAWKIGQAAFGWTETLGETVKGAWESTILSGKNREEWREMAAQNPPSDAENTMEKTWNFWIGGLIPYPF